MNKKHPTALVILDGWGYSSDWEHNAIAQANPETFNFLWSHYPHALLRASGDAVGLPEGVPGNSEVGHLTIGAGRIIPQPITLINNAITENNFNTNPNLVTILKECIKKNGRLHLLGLLSDGLVHSNIEHLYALIKSATEYGISHIYIHAFLDGRDVAPFSAEKYLQQLEPIFQQNPTARLSSISGRFYAMDRNENWERTCAVYDMLTKNSLAQTTWEKVIQENYSKNISDEFIKPIMLYKKAQIQDNDTLIFFNTRPDRIRQLISLLLNIALPTQKQGATRPNVPVPKNLTIASMVRYHKLFNNPVLFEKKIPHNTLLDILEQHKKTIFTIAETEKYAHVTYFLNGGKELTRTCETRVMVPSPDVATYDMAPKMSAEAITQIVVESVQNNPCDFYLINYANADMVGHTGNFEKTKETIGYLDKQLSILYKIFIQEKTGTLYITSDHGKAEEMWDTHNNCPKTSHTTNLVPFIMVNHTLFCGSAAPTLPLAGLADVAPLIIKNMDF